MTRYPTGFGIRGLLLELLSELEQLGSRGAVERQPGATKERSMLRFVSRMALLALFLWTACAGPRPPADPLAGRPLPAPEEPLPTDPQVITGVLDNGLRYLIRMNEVPRQRAELRLVVDAGSVLEDDDQQGLAHLAEHMAFNGTEHFARQELVDYLESIGMRFGPDLNAYTSFDETVYVLKVPTDSVGMVEQGFQILEDWAHGISFEGPEIDKERGVVIEEWRLGRGAEARMRDRQFPILFRDSRYALRLPIGKKAVLESFPHNALRRFYHDWYRPGLMSVIAVGQFDPAWIEGLIRRHFERLPARENPRERTLFPVPGHSEPLVALASDPEATGSRVTVIYKQRLREEGTHGAYRQGLVEILYNAMLNERLSELTRRPEAPFLYGFSGQGRFVRTSEVYLLTAGVPDNGIQRGLKALMTEAQRLARHGFTPTELERARRDLLRSLEAAFQERDKTDSDRYASEYVRHVLTGEAIPGVVYEFALVKRYLPGITLEDVDRLARAWITGSNRVIMVNVPEKEGVAMPAGGDLLGILEAADTLVVEPYIDAVSDAPLVEAVPQPAPIIDRQTIEELEVVIWTLANGVRVILKPTDFKNDEVLFTAFSDGGTSLANDGSYVPAMTAAAVVREGGVGSFSQVELLKRLAGQIVAVSPYVNELQEGMSGQASPRDLETLLQLIYLYFTAPRRDLEAFLAYRQRLRGFLENSSASPDAAFRDTVSVTMAQYHHRRRPWSLELLEELDLDASLAFYRDRFADAGDFTFIFVGNFNLAAIKPLVQSYLGGLPTAGRDEKWRDVGVRPPGGLIRKTVRKGLEPKSVTQIVYTGHHPWSRQAKYEMGAIAQVLRLKLREVLREDLGGTYGVSVRSALSRYPLERFRFSIRFGSDPVRAAELTAVVFQQIDSLAAFGTTDKYLTKVQETQRRERETSLRENHYWLNLLESHAFHGEDLRAILDYEARVEGLSPAAIQAAAKRYLGSEAYVHITLLPEE